MKKLFLCKLIFAVSLAISAHQISAQSSAEKQLPLDGNIAANGSAVELRWHEAKPPRAGAVIVNRRILGETGADSWQAVSPALAPVMQYTDTTTRAGVGYEYQVMRTQRDILDVGYWLTGVEVPTVETRGTVYVLVEDSVAEPLTAHLLRFRRDLVGDGWRVALLRVPRDLKSNPLKNLENALSLRIWLNKQYQNDPFGNHAIVLVGRVPFTMSGQAAPDGHNPRPHPSDLFYADMDGRWPADQNGLLLQNSIPGNKIEMQIGRIDFSNLSEGNRDTEIALLRAYFDKNHHWRMGFIGDLRGAYGEDKNLIGERNALANIVGPDAVTEGGHHDVGQRQPWLWGVDFGAAHGSTYAEKYSNKTVFAINFGSHKQKIERPFNAMTALLAQPWYTIAVGWGGRPTWRLQHMALGGTIGDVHMRTVNNGEAERPYRETMDYFPTGSYFWRNPVWVNLLGDPTTRAFMLAPPTDVRVSHSDDGNRITWQASPDRDTLGYRLFRAPADSQIFSPVETDGDVLEELSFLDREGAADARYMVRAYGLKDVYAGSFYSLSQGAFNGPDRDLQQDFEITTAKGTPAALPEVFNTPQGDIIYAIIEGPQKGALIQTETGWRYTPPKDFTGTITLRFSAADPLKTKTGQLQIIVTE
ncbi:MAG: hypothetical protein ABJX32_04200 [Tateyamaria sp.]|uniref:hypothetical protein n=1 Tax=Tateyamaria sp. TaxID=1929288 RepID=UPI0032A10559